MEMRLESLSLVQNNEWLKRYRESFESCLGSSMLAMYEQGILQFRARSPNWCGSNTSPDCISPGADR